MKVINIGDITVSNHEPYTLIAGPCQLESLDHARMLADQISIAAELTKTPWVFKASYDKANRSSLHAQRGLGIDEGLSILSKIKNEYKVPILTDVHDAAQCAIAAEIVDIIQIPAFLSRQTDLLITAGETGAAINIKKGQFLAPWDMANVAAKIASTGNHRILLCERGTSFGYNMLVSDMRALPIMSQTGYPVVFDATHSVQLPGGKGVSSDGQREFVPSLARAAVAVGCAAVFIETHQDPDNAPSDGPNMLPISQLSGLLDELKKIDTIRKTTL
jgi:2-dehydro-3-deoxyphosphooctonate aldolase (KDO 8-P synthase)